MKISIITAQKSVIIDYAAHELQKYIYKIFGIFPEIINWEICNNFKNENFYFILAAKKDITEQNLFKDSIHVLKSNQDYLIKSIDSKTLLLCGYDETGALYSVYGLLEDHLDSGFYYSGDTIKKKTEFSIPHINDFKSPRQKIRGILPWTNFPQSATSYSMKDWKFVIDRTAKMRMNLINIHNYTGFVGHNEMFHSFEYNKIMPRVSFKTAKTGHAWDCPGGNPNKYLFGTANLFSDSDFGSDATLHNESLDNYAVFAKGRIMLKEIISYAHSRGVKIALGIEPDLLDASYGSEVSPEDEQLINIRTNQIIKDYVNLDYLIIYHAEVSYDDSQKQERWLRIFNRMYHLLKQGAPNIKICVSGWGLKSCKELPKDVIIAPIAPYCASFESGDEYKGYDCWGIPWMERDMNSSQWFYPYNINLSDTIASYQQHKNNMSGFLALTWRLTDAIDPKLSYIAKAPWYDLDRYDKAEKVYSEYAMNMYGTDEVTDITCENEAFATNFGECEQTPVFSGADRTSDIVKATEQIEKLNKISSNLKGKDALHRLSLLKSRIESVLSYCLLDMNINSYSLEEVVQNYRSISESFLKRTLDISSVGNNVSFHNRLIGQRFTDEIKKRLACGKALLTENMNVSEYYEPEIKVISPPESIRNQDVFALTATVISETFLGTPVFHYRKSADTGFDAIQMNHKIKTTYEVSIRTIAGDGMIEYYITCGNPADETRYPLTGTNVCIVYGEALPKSFTPVLRTIGSSLLISSEFSGYYKLYRKSNDSYFYLTYLPGDTTEYSDIGDDFDGNKLTGEYSYFITSVEENKSESEPSEVVTIAY